MAGFSASAATITYPPDNASPIILNDNSTELQVLTGSATQSGVISESGGSFGPVKIGGGTLVLTANNTYTGTTVISDGTLQVGDGRTTGSIPSSIVNDNGSLVFDRSDNITFSGRITGTGNVVQAGPGTLALTGQALYTGGTVVTGGGTLSVAFAPGDYNSLLSTLTLDNGTLAPSASYISSARQTYVLGAGGGTILDSFGTSVEGQITGSGHLTLTSTRGIALDSGINNWTGGTIITSGSTVSMKSVVGNIDNEGELIFNAGGYTFTGTVSGAGAVAIAGGLTFTGNSNYTGGTLIGNGAVLHLGDGGTSGSITGDIEVAANSFTGYISAFDQLNAPGLVFEHSDDYTFAGVISGGGAVEQAGSGTTYLTANNTYTGGTVIGGVLAVSSDSNLGDDQGAINIGNHGTLRFDADVIVPASRALILSNNIFPDDNSGGSIDTNGNDVEIAGAVSGRPESTLTKIGAGTLTLSGTSFYEGSVVAAAGTLSVTGFLQAALTTVQSGAVLEGTGTVSTVEIQSGGTLAPGLGGAGSLNAAQVNFDSGAIYNIAISPVANTATAISGAASLDGSVSVSAASGTYVAGQQYTILTAQGGVTGVFSSVSASGLPVYLRPDLSYDANDVYLDLDMASLAAILPAGATGNQKNIADALDKSFANTIPTGGFLSFYSLNGPALGAALNQLEGGANANVAQAVSAAASPFLDLLLQQPGADTGTSTANNDVSPNGVLPAQLSDPGIHVWGAGLGGHGSFSDHTSAGAPGLSTNVRALAVGADVGIGVLGMAGVSIAAGHNDFRSGNSASGKSDDVQFALYGHLRLAEHGYIAAGLSYGTHDVDTSRIVTIAGTDKLAAHFHAHDWSGKIEGGNAFALDDDWSITPYFSLLASDFQSPAYGETAVAGSSTFALDYGARSSTYAYTQLGAHLSRDFGFDDDQVLTTKATAAWAHQISGRVALPASFESLSDASFAITGVHTANNTAVLQVDAHMHGQGGFGYGADVQSRLGRGTTEIYGLGYISYDW